MDSWMDVSSETALTTSGCSGKLAAISIYLSMDKNRIVGPWGVGRHEHQTYLFSVVGTGEQYTA